MSDNEAQIVPDPNAWPEQPDEIPKCYVVRNNDRNCKDEPIHELDVARPANKKYTTMYMDEYEQWKSVSTQGCPTYGNCVICFCSGPAGMQCVRCKVYKRNKAWYLTRYLEKSTLNDDGYHRSHERQYIDAQWLAQMLNLDCNIIARADRKANFLISPIRAIDAEGIEEGCKNLVPEYIHWCRETPMRKDEVRLIYMKIMIDLWRGWSESPSEVECPPITDNRSVLDE